MEHPSARLCTWTQARNVPVRRLLMGGEVLMMY